MSCSRSWVFYPVKQSSGLYWGLKGQNTEYKTLIHIQIVTETVNEAMAEVSVIEFCKVICTTEMCIKYLRQHNLVCNSKNCHKCYNPMQLEQKPLYVTSDGQQWVCHKCRTSASIRNGSIFQVCMISVHHNLLNYVQWSLHYEATPSAQTVSWGYGLISGYRDS